MKKSLFIFLFTLFFLFFSFGQKKISDAQFDPENPSQNARGSLQGAGGSAQDASAQYPDETITLDDIQIPVPEVFTPLDYVPEIFNGIWEGDDRYIMFQNQDELASIIG
ncbi:hypothetical protein, partial [Treponema sp.]|uniref:hypothetical protein n=1 Tax=Treponema sp. TaxID=166 RepID=UPI00298DE741